MKGNGPSEPLILLYENLPIGAEIVLTPVSYAALQPVAAGEACVRLRSSRKPYLQGLPETPRTLISRLLRSRTQASPAATGVRLD